MRRRLMPAIFIAFLFGLSGTLFAQSTEVGWWHLEYIHTPSRLSSPGNEPVVVAIIDDAFRTSHQTIREFIWRNDREQTGNRVDDDGNGYIDDAHGWDIVDNDPDVTPPSTRMEEFYHGTHLASIVTTLATKVFGESAGDLIKIMPVKSIGDLAPDFYIRDGYGGIEYAIDSGADIVVCAWGSFSLDADEQLVLKKAEEKGVLIVAAAGNSAVERQQYPAAYSSALAVASIGKNGRPLPDANFGEFVDIAAPGEEISGADTVSDSDIVKRDGSSFATALTAGAAAIIMAVYPDYSWAEVAATLKASATPFLDVGEKYAARYGAGILNLGKALQHPIREMATETGSISSDEGFLATGTALSANSLEWTIEPPYAIEGVRVSLFSYTGDPGSMAVTASAGGNIIGKYRPDAFPSDIYLPGRKAELSVSIDGSDSSLILAYSAVPLDLRSRYCSGTKQLALPGTIGDGSGPEPYANLCDCKWQITAPQGKVVRFYIEEFETEPVADKLYFFNGTGTQEMIMAVFSGPSPPKVFTSWTNQALLWFVTDGENRFDGWTVRYEFIDPPPR